MIFEIRYVKSSTVFGRLRDASGNYWNFSTHQWDAAESNDTKVSMPEQIDGDPKESAYYGTAAKANCPPGGPWRQEAVDSSTGATIGYDSVMGELLGVPTAEASVLEKIQYVFQYFGFKRAATGSQETMYRDDDTTPLSTAALSDDNTTFTKDKAV